MVYGGHKYNTVSVFIGLETPAGLANKPVCLNDP